MPTIIQSDKIASRHLGKASAFGLVVPSYVNDVVFHAAYSLRQLRQTYTGPVLRVRNDTNNATADVAFADFMTTTASVVTIVAAGTSGYSVGQTMTLATFAGAATVKVVRWYDQSGNGRTLGTYDTATMQPTLMTAGAFETQGGFTCLTFDGASDRLDTTAAAGGGPAWTLPQPFSVVAAGRTAPSGTGTFFDFKRASAADTAGFLYAASGGRSIYGGALLSDGGVTDVSKQRVYGARFTGAASQIYVDGVNTVTGNAGTNTAEDFRLGVTWNNAPIANRYFEALVLPEATTDLVALSRRVMAYYGML